MFEKHCSGTDLKNIHSVIVHCVSRKTVNATFSFRSSLLIVHAFTKTEETRIKIKLCGIFLDGSVNNVYPFMVLPKKTMGCQFINTHNKPISEVTMLTQTFKSEMHPRFSIALCIQVNQHKKKQR
jgi:hypothetical protein